MRNVHNDENNIVNNFVRQKIRGKYIIFILKRLDHLACKITDVLLIFIIIAHVRSAHITKMKLCFSLRRSNEPNFKFSGFYLNAMANTLA